MRIIIFQIAAEVSAPLAKTEDIVLIGGTDQLSAEVTKLVSQIPPSVQALTGVDLTKVHLHKFQFFFYFSNKYTKKDLDKYFKKHFNDGRRMTMLFECCIL